MRLAPAASGPGQITVVVDPDDNAEVARVVGRACRRRGRFVVHTSPGQYAAARFQSEVLGALGKHWGRAAQGGNATTGQLVRAWLRAERARDLIVLRAHQVSGPALSWLLSLPVREYLRVWLISPQPLTTVADVASVRVTSGTGTWPDGDLAAHDEADCECDDLNRFAPASVTGMSATAGLTVDTARRLRRLYDIEAAALATAAVLLECPDPDALAAARIRVAEDAGSVVTAQGAVLAVPEYAQALLRGWAGQSLLPREWAHDVAATYLTLRLEAAERHIGVRLIDPNLPQLPRVAWHDRRDPGASTLAWLTRSHWRASHIPDRGPYKVHFRNGGG
jgi:hypothetical protein